MILVSAIEVGSVRSLLPVCRELIYQNKDIVIDKKGFFDKKECEDLNIFFIRVPFDNLSIKNFLIRNNIKTLLFSVNVHSIFPLRLARIAASMNINTIHVIDYWNGYSSRMMLDRKALFQPRRYLVPDIYAKKMAINEGIDEDKIVVTGQPALADAEEAFLRNKSNLFYKLPQVSRNKKIILFVSEPVKFDQGVSLQENENFRGYVEKDSLKILIDALKNLENEFYLILLPHPRQNLKELSYIWKTLGGDSYGCIIANTKGRNFLPFVSGVSGMSSTLLYEAWLVGIPILSIQPGLINDSLRMMQYKRNVTFIDRYDCSTSDAKKWLKFLNFNTKHIFQSDMKLHTDSPKLVAKEVLSLHSKVKG